MLWAEVVLKHLEPIRLLPSADWYVCGLGNAFKVSACAQVSLIFYVLLVSPRSLGSSLTMCSVSVSQGCMRSLSQLFYVCLISRITLLNFWLLHRLLWTWTSSWSWQSCLKHFPCAQLSPLLIAGKAVGLWPLHWMAPDSSCRSEILLQNWKLSSEIKHSKINFQPLILSLVSYTKHSKES